MTMVAAKAVSDPFPKGEQMNDGVALLLDRMKTHPEEFAVGEGVIGKWDSLVREYETILDPEDVALFKQARSKLLQQQFTEKVMEELIDPIEGSKVKKGNAFTHKFRQAALALGQTPPIPPITLEQTEHLRAHLDALALGQTPIAGVTQTL